MNAANHERSELDLACEKIRKLLSEADLDDAFARYTVGTIVQRVKEHPETFGDNGVDQLKDALAVGRSSLYRYARVAQRWDEAAILAVLNRRTHSGARLSWRHLELLSQVSDAGHLESLIETVLATDLFVRQLQQLINASKPVRRDRDHDSIEAVASRFIREAAELTAALQLLQSGSIPISMMSILARCEDSCRSLASATSELVARAKQVKAA